LTFADKLRYDGVDGENLKLVKNPDFINVSKLAIKYSDAIIIGSEEINSELYRHIKSVNKPYLDYHDESTYVDAYNDFYDKILS
jgi:starch synthase